ncbi:endonuclease/exonuclease/phosphatase family protein [Streptomyces atriruber]|uniref:endonuclease/exonuclease/phosphatase family protein n=1 Tax=Streptomyces atriruber TaxID=545121 RepID=UPI0012FF5A11|nr:endonuclease/exonuclease/phosphatase family protein [Streptomyces atriruber]
MTTRATRRTRGPVRTLVSLAALLGSTLLWTGPAASAAPTEPGAVPAAAASYTIGQFNMAGGNTQHGDDGDEAPDALVRSVQDRKPAFMTLNEACADWSNRLQSQLGSEYTVLFDPVTKGAGGPNTKCYHPVGVPEEQRTDFGNGLLVRNDLGFDTTTLVGHGLGTSADREQREMLCMTSPARQLALCSVHLTHNSKSERRKESARAREILDTTYAGYTKFLGGDLNAEPLHQAPDNFYHSDYGRGALGQFKEADSHCGNDPHWGDVIGGAPFPVFLWCRDGEATMAGDNKKIDYLFVPMSTHVDWADATDALHSDHKLLWAGVTF